MRLAVDFGLHVSTKAYVEAGTMTVEEARGRSVTFWGAFATDQSVSTYKTCQDIYLTHIQSMWGLYLGRPLHNISQAVTVETPTAFSGSRYQDRPTYSPHHGNGPQNGLLDHQERFVEQWVQLPRIMSPLESCL